MIDYTSSNKDNKINLFFFKLFFFQVFGQHSLVMTNASSNQEKAHNNSKEWTQPVQSNYTRQISVFVEGQFRL